MAYYYTLDNEYYFLRWSVGAAFEGCSKLPDGVDVPDALKTCSCNVRAYKYINREIVYDPERENVSDLYEPAGGSGTAGRDGKDGISCTHSWSGTTLTVTSASGTSSADLKGEKGDKGDTGERGEKGDTGGVASFNGRTGAIVPTTGDYTAAMVGAAPSGYGLGGGGTACSDCNNATVNGWYSCGGAANTPRGFPYGWMLVSSRSGTGGMIRQDYYSALSVPEHYQRHHVDGVWSEWECITPGLALGVEYRTTDRFMGKPVYVCAVDFGALPNASKKRIAHGCEVTGFLISSQAFVRYSDTDGSCVTLNNYEYVSACFATRDYLTVTTTTDMSGWQKAYFILKYTKDTD